MSRKIADVYRAIDSRIKYRDSIKSKDKEDVGAGLLSRSNVKNDDNKKQSDPLDFVEETVRLIRAKREGMKNGKK